jgi:hypothetical protein
MVDMFILLSLVESLNASKGPAASIVDISNILKQFGSEVITLSRTFTLAQFHNTSTIRRLADMF